MKLQTITLFYLNSQGYIENAVQCSGHGTYMCGICACAPDFFGRRCECDAENMNFGGDLVSFPLSNFPSHHFRLRFCIIHIMSDRAVPLLRADAKSCHLMSYCT